MNNDEFNLSYEESIGLREEIVARHRQYIQRRLVQKLPLAFLVSFCVGFIIVGAVEFILQIVLVAEKGPLYFIGHGFWGGFISVLFGTLGLFLIKYRTFKFYKIILIIGVFDFTLTVAAFTAIPFASYSISKTVCYDYEKQDMCQSSNQAIVLVMGILGILVNLAALVFLIGLPVIINGGFSLRRFYEEQDVNFQMSTPRSIQPRSVSNNRNFVASPIDQNDIGIKM